MISRFLLTAVWLVLAAGPARAAANASSDHFEVALLSEHKTIAPGRPFYVGLRMEPERGWHTYWKNPGDAGLPLRVEWTLPPGFSAGPIEWPVPVRLLSGPLASYGYDRETLFPVRIVPPEAIPAGSVRIAGKFDWLECEEICVPGTAALDLVIPVRADEPRNGPAAPLFAEARARSPVPLPEAWSVRAEAGPRAISLTGAVPGGTPGVRGGYFFADQPLVAEYAGPQGFEAREGGYRLTFPPAEARTGFPERLTGVLVLQGAGPKGTPLAFAIDVPLSSGDPAPAAAQPAAAAGASAAERTGSLRIPMAAVAGVVALGGLGFILIRRRNRRAPRDRRERT